jgi:hypothetical protein
MFKLWDDHVNFFSGCIHRLFKVHLGFDRVDEFLVLGFRENNFFIRFIGIIIPLPRRTIAVLLFTVVFSGGGIRGNKCRWARFSGFEPL